MKKALIVQGGWDGHEPKQVSELFADILKKEEFSVEVSDTLDSFGDEDRLRSLDLTYHVLECMHGVHIASESGKHYDVASTCARPDSLPLDF